MRGILRRLGPAAVTGAVLAACGGGYTVVDFRTENGHYSNSFLRYAATNGGIHVDVRNNPYDGAAADRLGETLASALQDANSQTHDVAFTTTPGADGAAYRVVALFNPAAGARSERLCADARQPTRAPEGDRVNVIVAFCNGDQAFRWVRASRTQPGGAESAGMRDLFHAVGRELFEPDSDDAGAGGGFGAGGGGGP